MEMKTPSNQPYHSRTFWTWQQEVILDAMERLDNQPLKHLVDEEQDVFRSWPLNQHYQLRISGNRKPDTSEHFQIAYYCCLLITFANSSDPDQARQNVGPDLDPNCLTLINCLIKLCICSVTPSKTNVNYFRPCCIIQPLYHGKSINEL